MAHAAPAAPGRHMTGLKVSPWHLVAPLGMGLLYGLWCAFMKRERGTLPVDAANIWYGILCGVVFAVAWFVLARVGPALPRELRATMWFAFAGISFGYLYSLTNDSIWRTVVVALSVAVPVGAGAFYRYYMREP
ncbi:hypothetical protein [Streptomyces sp. NRRL S-87]|uniref:hypothetical protein n=1 Tax=Streptomyces sp. NRRL S-87 TaxID=1463920 RepID=UPI0004BF920C|nr:hypothetical protein [Streptomyces sp. NRRL S-87]